MTRRFDPATMGFMNDAGLWLPTMTLWQREMVRFFRQRNRVVGAMATPLVFWLLLGFGFQGAFVIRGSDINYLAYFFPGTVVLVIMFTAIFSTISVIEDRREGFLQGVMVAPMPRLSLVLGKVLGGASIATIQGVLFLLLWPLVGSWPGWAATAAAVGVMFVLALALTGFGLLLAWPMDSVAGFHAIMNLVLMPMWFLSGAMFPVDSAPFWLGWAMRANPLTYGQEAFAAALNGEMAGSALLVTVVFAVVMIVWCAAIVSRPRKYGSG